VRRGLCRRDSHAAALPSTNAGSGADSWHDDDKHGLRDRRSDSADAANANGDVSIAITVFLVVVGSVAALFAAGFALALFGFLLNAGYEAACRIFERHD
jgi:hypothetical protein